ncbi:hypothetical protein J6590_034745 [Homalodisca vitripennis]|nr:hypothetical protein J6590_034745 [Homalodisca vitripennis]
MKRQLVRLTRNITAHAFVLSVPDFWTPDPRFRLWPVSTRPSVDPLTYSVQHVSHANAYTGLGCLQAVTFFPGLRTVESSERIELFLCTQMVDYSPHQA